MGKFDFNVSPEFIKQLGRLQDIERVAPMMIDEAIPILEDSVKRETAQHKFTGDLHRSIKRTKAKMTKSGGFYAAVLPVGKDSKGVSNMQKMAYLEYGTSKQNATPVLTKAINDSQNSVEKRMQQTFEREMNK